MSLFVIADAHGNGPLVRGLLKQEDLPREGVTVIQIGDLANCVAASEQEDIDALQLVGGAIDLMLVGNHEHPHFGGPAFTGFWPHIEVRRRLLDLNDRGLLQPSFAVADILVTHAGVTAHMNEPPSLKEGQELGGRAEEDEWKTAQEADEELRYIWHHFSKLAPAFSAIGPERGGGRGSYGGVLWADWAEPKTTKFRQVVGHTVGKTIRRRDRAVCIDLGAGYRAGRIAGAWIVKGKIRTVRHERKVD